MILPVFKAGDPSLRGVDGGFDSHTLPPSLSFLSQHLDMRDDAFSEPVQPVTAF